MFFILFLFSLSLGLTLPQYVDNSATLELLERKGAGILSMIDEEISVPKGTDDTLLNKIFKNYASHPNVKKSVLCLIPSL
jgi:myosin heavy subunit